MRGLSFDWTAGCDEYQTHIFSTSICVLRHFDLDNKFGDDEANDETPAQQDSRAKYVHLAVADGETVVTVSQSLHPMGSKRIN